MKLLFKVLTVVTILAPFHGHTNSCEEVELGAIGKNHWKDSISNGLRGELVSQIGKKDDLFEKLVPEIEIDLTPSIDFNLTFSRGVKDNLPLPVSGKISEFDFFTLKVQNKLHVEFKGEASGPYLFAGGNAGLELTHASHHFPGKSVPTCELYSKIIDKNTAKGKQFYEAACVSRSKSRFARYYESLVNFFSSRLGTGISYLVDTEKNEKFAEDPLAALKVHSLLGVPLDHRVFLENSNDLAVGDIVEHTSFFGITPLGVKLDIFEFLTPSYSRYRRLFRTLGFKKVIGNKVVVEVEDTVISGSNTEIYKINPKILNIIKLNLGKWGSDDFKQENLVQRFEVDLTKDSGIEFFKNVLYSAYTPSLKLNRNSILIDHSDYKDSVTAKSPVYKDGEGRDHKLVFKFPGIFDFERRTYENIENIIYEGKEHTNGEKIRRKQVKFKLGADLKLFEIKKRDKKFECQMKLSSNANLVLEDNSSLNIECNYENEYSENEQPKQVGEFVDMILNGEMDVKDKNAIMELEYPTREEIHMYTNLSFSKKQITKIINTDDEKIYHEISKLLYGEESKNVFAKKYHTAWQKARPRSGPRAPISSKIRTHSKKYKNCGSLFSILGITQGVNPMYTKFDGTVGRGKGIDAYDSRRCYNYFKQATQTVSLVREIRESMQKTGRLNKVLDLFLELEKVGYAQALLVRLAGGIGKDKVRFSYIIASPFLDNVVAASNGKKYEVENKNIRKSISTELEPVFFPRIKDLKFTYTECNPKVILATFKLNYRIEDRKSIFGKFQLTKYHLTDNNPLHTEVVRFDNIIKNADGEYIVRIELDEELNKNEAHNMYFEVLNQNDFRLSREVKVFLKEVDSLLQYDL